MLNLFILQVYRGPETRHLIESLDCGVEYVMRVCPVRMMRKTLSSKRIRESRSSGIDSEATDSRSSSCSQRDNDSGVLASAAGGDGDTNDCDNSVEELMGQWSPVLSYVVPSLDHAEHHHHHHHHP